MAERPPRIEGEPPEEGKEPEDKSFAKLVEMIREVAVPQEERLREFFEVLGRVGYTIAESKRLPDKDQQAMENLGRVLSEVGQFKRALETLLELAKKYPVMQIYARGEVTILKGMPRSLERAELRKKLEGPHSEAAKAEEETVTTFMRAMGKISELEEYATSNEQFRNFMEAYLSDTQTFTKKIEEERENPYRGHASPADYAVTVGFYLYPLEAAKHGFESYDEYTPAFIEKFPEAQRYIERIRERLTRTPEDAKKYTLFFSHQIPAIVHAATPPEWKDNRIDSDEERKWAKAETEDKQKKAREYFDTMQKIFQARERVDRLAQLEKRESSKSRDLAILGLIDEAIDQYVSNFSSYQYEYQGHAMALQRLEESLEAAVK